MKNERPHRIDMEISPEKKQKAQENLVSTVKFWAVFCPLLLVFGASVWFKAHAEIPNYHRDCRSAPTVATPAPSSFPCYNEVATAQLQNYYSRGGGRSDQELLLTFLDGRTASMQADSDSNRWWTSSEVDGPCLTEVWHGIIRAALKPNAKILSKQNPERDGNTSSLIYYVVVPGTLTLTVWVGLFVLWQKGYLSKNIS